jgi:hypothetical protein
MRCIYSITTTILAEIEQEARRSLRRDDHAASKAAKRTGFTAKFSYMNHSMHFIARAEIKAPRTCEGLACALLPQ